MQWQILFTDKFGNSMMEGFLEKFKDTLKTGDEKLGIPVLDPFKAEELALNLKEDIIKCVPFQFFNRTVFTKLTKLQSQVSERLRSLSSFFPSSFCPFYSHKSATLTCLLFSKIATIA